MSDWNNQAEMRKVETVDPLGSPLLSPLSHMMRAFRKKHRMEMQEMCFPDASFLAMPYYHKVARFSGNLTFNCIIFLQCSHEPQQNGYGESLNGSLRDECLNEEMW